MYFKNKTSIFIFILFNLIFYSNSQEQKEILVISTDKNLTYSCSNNVYQFNFEVKLSEKLDEIIPFELNIALPYNLPFKCVIDGPKSNILCFHSFSNYVWSLIDNSRIELPYSFPEIEGIKWDYDSFLRKIYRYLWRTVGNCGLEFEVNNQSNQISESKIDIISDVIEIYGGKCNSSKYEYNFEMKIKLFDGEIFKELQNAKNNNKTEKFEFLHGIYAPVLLGEKEKKGKTIFRKDNEYKYARCYNIPEINQDNFNDKEGIYFSCQLKVNKYNKFKGPLQIKPFTDYAFIKKIDINGKISINRIGIKFEILSGFEELEPTKSQTGNLNSGKKPGEIEPNFLLLNSDLNTFICPDKPILIVKNYNEGITFGGLNDSGNKYLFIISGYLSNGYEYINNTLSLMDITKDEIIFNLKITDNLENADDKKKYVSCYIPTGTSINKNALIDAQCYGSKKESTNKNTDILLNWNLEENNNFENILIKWPYDLKKKKNIFYYEIKGLSVKKDNFGCFENKFFFYLYVYDLKAEPKISFNLPLISPKYSNAVCKLYNSVTFKCIINLRLQHISKGSKIILPSKIKEFLPNKEQNLVLYKVDNSSFSSSMDFQLPVEEDCGDFRLIGALKDIGYTYLQVIIIIVCVCIGLAICISGVTFCIIYEILHRNKKGVYFKHAEEKEIPNTSKTFTQN